jgi:hypothetical protein
VAVAAGPVRTAEAGVAQADPAAQHDHADARARPAGRTAKEVRRMVGIPSRCGQSQHSSRRSAAPCRARWPGSSSAGYRADRPGRSCPPRTPVLHRTRGRARGSRPMQRPRLEPRPGPDAPAPGKPGRSNGR